MPPRKNAGNIFLLPWHRMRGVPIIAFVADVVVVVVGIVVLYMSSPTYYTQFRTNDNTENSNNNFGKKNPRANTFLPYKNR